MLKLKILLVLLPAIVSFNYITPLQIQQPAKQISFFDKRDTVVLKEEDYDIAQREAGFDLWVKNKVKLNKIAKLNNPQSKFTSNNQVYRAVGLFIYSSHVPDIGDYYFPINEHKRIIIFKGNILNFKQPGY